MPCANFPPLSTDSPPLHHLQRCSEMGLIFHLFPPPSPPTVGARPPTTSSIPSTSTSTTTTTTNKRGVTAKRSVYVQPLARCRRHCVTPMRRRNSSGRPASRLRSANARCVRSEDDRSLGTARRLRRRRRGAVLWLQLGPVLRQHCVPHHCERPQLSPHTLTARAAPKGSADSARGARTQSVTSLRRSPSFAAADRRRR